MLSIIIPTYKREKEVNTLVDSIFAMESYGVKFEVIVINDDKNDIKINEKATMIKNKENIGGHISRGRGFKKSLGDYILFLDDDDILKEDFFLIFNEIKPKSEVIYFDLEIESKSGKIKTNKFIKKHANKPWLINTLFQNKIFSREIVKENYFTNVKLYQDENFFFKAINKSTKYQIINKPIIIYKYNWGSVSKNNNHKKRFENILENYNDFLSDDSLMGQYAAGRLYSFLVFWNKKYNLKFPIKSIKKTNKKYTWDDRGRFILATLYNVFLMRWK